MMMVMMMIIMMMITMFVPYEDQSRQRGKDVARRLDDFDYADDALDADDTDDDAQDICLKKDQKAEHILPQTFGEDSEMLAEDLYYHRVLI